MPFKLNPITGKLDVVNSKNIKNGSAQGEMTFWDSTLGKWVNAETSEMFWDDTNKRLGIGTAVPSNPIQIDKSQNAPTLYGVTNLNNAANSAAGFAFNTNNSVGLFLAVDNNWTGAGVTGYDLSFLEGSVLLGTTAGEINLATIAGYDIGFYPFCAAYNTPAMIIKGSGSTIGNVGIGVTVPTASIHIKAGTATAGTAPVKLTSGTVNTTPEAGAIEFDGTDLFITI